MRTPLTEEKVALLARAAGFPFAPERCQLLASQLEWLLSEADHLSQLDLAGTEPVCIYRLEAFPSVETEIQGRTPDDQKTPDEPE